jgi:hypothetical protein
MFSGQIHRFLKYVLARAFQGINTRSSHLLDLFFKQSFAKQACLYLRSYLLPTNRFVSLPASITLNVYHLERDVLLDYYEALPTSSALLSCNPRIGEPRSLDSSVAALAAFAVTGDDVGEVSLRFLPTDS